MTTPSSLIRAHVFVSGKVQGVAYRYSTVHQATNLGVNGWVRNLADERVEAVFEGSKEAVEEMLKWCKKGPPAAIVKNVAVDFEEPQGLKGFELRH